MVKMSEQMVYKKTISLVFKRLIIMWLSLAQQRKCSNSTEMSIRIFWYKECHVISKLKQYTFYRQRFQITSHNNVQSGAQTRALNYAHVDWLKRRER